MEKLPRWFKKPYENNNGSQPLYRRNGNGCKLQLKTKLDTLRFNSQGILQ